MYIFLSYIDKQNCYLIFIYIKPRISYILSVIMLSTWLSLKLSVYNTGRRCTGILFNLSIFNGAIHHGWVGGRGYI